MALAMIKNVQRSWPLLLLFALLFHLHLGHAAGQIQQDDLVQQYDDHSYTAPQADSPQGVFGFKHASSNDIPGASQVREALEILHRIKPYAYRTTPSNRPAGILGSSIHQAKRVFAFLFLSTSSAAVNASSEPRTSSLREPLATAVALLEDAVTVHNDDAVFTLAEMSFFGKYGYPRDYARSAHLYEALAVRTGNATAQHRTGFMFATGIGGVKEKDQAKALLYHTFAADGGSIHSQMTVAFRHHAGISTPRDCERATAYYKKVADRAIAYVKDGPPGGKHVTKEAFHLADEEGGVYGEGASSSSAGLNAKQAGPTSDAGAAFDDVLEYLDLMSRKGEVKATFGLGRLHYDGSRALKQDYHAAKNYFLDVARRYWTKEGKIKEDTETSVDRYAAKAAGYLGCMFLRGEGMEQNFQKARVWFKRGIDNGDALCEYSMGLMHLHGLGVNKDPVKAAEYFASAADQDFASAQVRLGVLLMDQGDLASALRYFEFATRHGHIEAFYYLAEISNQGIGRERSCSTACLYYKMVAEKAEPLHSMFLEANDAYEAGDVDMALLGYMLAAEQGYEVAQANVAYLLDRPQHRPLFSFITRRASSILHDSALALVYWTRSARQANIDSMVKMGDYYLYGTGTDLDREKAAACYTAAAETLQSAQAMWNLGWMHENGIGIVQDFHLAKRFYDQSLETNREAYLPVSLALLKLRARSAWNTFTHGKINSIHDDPKPEKRYSFSEWLVNFLEADAERYAGAEDADEWDTTAGGIVGADGDFYDEVDVFDDGVGEVFIILGLAAALALLVYFRQRQQHGERRPPPAPPEGRERGMFPAPEDPEFANWAVGGVGH